MRYNDITGQPQPGQSTETFIPFGCVSAKEALLLIDAMQRSNARGLERVHTEMIRAVECYFDHTDNKVRELDNCETKLKQYANQQQKVKS